MMIMKVRKYEKTGFPALKMGFEIKLYNSINTP